MVNCPIYKAKNSQDHEKPTRENQRGACATEKKTGQYSGLIRVPLKWKLLEKQGGDKCLLIGRASPSNNYNQARETSASSRVRGHCPSTRPTTFPTKNPKEPCSTLVPPSLPIFFTHFQTSSLIDIGNKLQEASKSSPYPTAAASARVRGRLLPFAPTTSSVASH